MQPPLVTPSLPITTTHLTNLPGSSAPQTHQALPNPHVSQLPLKNLLKSWSGILRLERGWRWTMCWHLWNTNWKNKLTTAMVSVCERERERISTKCQQCSEEPITILLGGTDDYSQKQHNRRKTITEHSTDKNRETKIPKLANFGLWNTKRGAIHSLIEQARTICLSIMLTRPSNLEQIFPKAPQLLTWLHFSLSCPSAITLCPSSCVSL